jgi:murein DD-endopeptidase MepM/ murein hydrolase activator NlpD
LIARANQVSAARPLLAGDTVFVPSSAGDLGPLPAIIRSYNFEPLPLVQGQTVVVRVQTDQPADLTGSLDGHQLAFFADGENSYVAIQGIHVMAEPGLIAFSLQASAANGDTHPFEEMLLLAAGEYEKDPPLNVAPETIDPAVTEPELDQIEALTAAATPTKYWDGPFGFPVDVYTCSRSPFGSRRSFNGSDYIYFHGGLDYGLCENSTIFAPAPGVVVFTGLLTVRGNATIIDHGWGVYSGIWHQSQIDVKVGDQVVTGQPIGKIGDTGRVTGAHLHWEIWANGVQVNPLDWLARSFP